MTLAAIKAQDELKTQFLDRANWLFAFIVDKILLSFQ